MTMRGGRLASNSAVPVLLSLDDSHSYLNRRGQRVRIIGEVEPHTAEYLQGYRFYGSGMSFFRSDGRIHEDVHHPHDLIGRFDVTDIEAVEEFPSERMWVDPDHRVDFVDLNTLSTNTGFTIGVARQYLNRMGFVVDIIDCDIVFDLERKTYQDSLGMIYDHQGRVFGDIPSMYDITLLITNINYIVSKDAEQIEALNEFNPEDEESLNREFFDLLLRGRTLAKKLNWEFDFKLFRKPTRI